MYQYFAYRIAWQCLMIVLEYMVLVVLCQQVVQLLRKLTSKLVTLIFIKILDDSDLFYRLYYENIQSQSSNDISIAPVKWQNDLYDMNR